MGRIIAILASSCILAGCSSSMLPSIDFFKSSPSPESLRVESEPPGAEAKTVAGQSCRTPCELKVQPGTDQSITLALDGYQPHTVPLTGDAGKLTPNPIYVELKTVAPAAAKKKKTAAKKPKPKPTTTAAVATPTAAAIAPAPTQPAAAPEPAPATNNSYPWSNPR